jgi:hypothetical protein
MNAMAWLTLTLAAAVLPGRVLAQTPPSAALDNFPELLTVKRVFVDRLTGGETAAQMRDLLISSLQNSKLFVLTENAERADAFMRGAAEDLVFTDQFQTSEGVRMSMGTGDSSGSTNSTRANGVTNSASSRGSRRLNLGVSDSESTNIHERKHEAMATVRIVNKDGDVIWSTTQESTGAKFRGASADVADKITKQLVADVDKLRRK